MKSNLLSTMVGDSATAFVPHWEPVKFDSVQRFKDSSGMNILRRSSFHWLKSQTFTFKVILCFSFAFRSLYLV